MISEALSSRLAEISRLTFGWLDGHGEPISSIAINNTRLLLEAGFDKDVTLYPSCEGGVYIEKNDVNNLDDCFYISSTGEIIRF